MRAVRFHEYGETAALRAGSIETPKIERNGFLVEAGFPDEPLVPEMVSP